MGTAATIRCRCSISASAPGRASDRRCHTRIAVSSTSSKGGATIGGKEVRKGDVAWFEPGEGGELCHRGGGGLSRAALRRRADPRAGGGLRALRHEHPAGDPAGLPGLPGREAGRRSGRIGAWLPNTETTNDIKVDPKALYLEEIFTDRRVGTIRRLTPVGKDGERDAGARGALRRRDAGADAGRRAADRLRDRRRLARGSGREVRPARARKRSSAR